MHQHRRASGVLRFSCRLASKHFPPQYFNSYRMALCPFPAHTLAIMDHRAGSPGALDTNSDKEYEEIDVKVVEAVYLADPGYFIFCSHGWAYHLWHQRYSELLGRTAIFVPRGLAFQIDCPVEEQSAAYHLVYARWYHTYLQAQRQEMIDFCKAFCVPRPDGKFEYRPGLTTALVQAQNFLNEGKPVQEAIDTVWAADWDGHLEEVFDEIFFVCDIKMASIAKELKLINDCECNNIIKVMTHSLADTLISQRTSRSWQCQNLRPCKSLWKRRPHAGLRMRRAIKDGRNWGTSDLTC
jgi:hypothetical protein